MIFKKSILFLFITCFVVMSLTGCNDKTHEHETVEIGCDIESATEANKVGEVIVTENNSEHEHENEETMKPTENSSNNDSNNDNIINDNTNNNNAVNNGNSNTDDTENNNGNTDSSNADNENNNSNYLGNFRLTAYCNCSTCCGKWAGGATASGVMPVANHTIAVDTSVIPFGTKVVINGNTYVAEDTGSSIVGNRIDVYFNSHQEALNFGVQYADVYKVVD